MMWSTLIHPAVTSNYSAVQYASHQIGNEVVSGWVFNVTLSNEFNITKNVAINCTLIKSSSLVSFTYYSEKEAMVPSNSSLSVEIYIPNAQIDGF
jgi:hypothetical protein